MSASSGASPPAPGSVAEAAPPGRPPRKSGSQTFGLRVVALAISAALLWWFVADGRWRGVADRLAGLDAGALAGVAALFAASYAMRGARIHGEFRGEIAGGVTGYLRVLRLTLVHNALVNVLPFRGGEVAFPVLLSRWFGIGTGRAVVSLLWLRAQDATVVLALAAIAWPGLPVVLRVVAVAAIVGGAALVPLWARRRARAVAGRADAAGRAARLWALLERSTRRSAAGWSWTVGNWSVKLAAEAWLVALALSGGTQGPATAGGLATGFLGAVGAELASILPIQGVAGFGTFEAGGAALLRTVAVPLASGLEAVLVLHAVVLALAVGAGVVAAVVLPGPFGDARPASG